MDTISIHPKYFIALYIHPLAQIFSINSVASTGSSATFFCTHIRTMASIVVSPRSGFKSIKARGYGTIQISDTILSHDSRVQFLLSAPVIPYSATIGDSQAGSIMSIHLYRNQFSTASELTLTVLQMFKVLYLPPAKNTNQRETLVGSI